jgi:hypothetical protein
LRPQLGIQYWPNLTYASIFLIRFTILKQRFEKGEWWPGKGPYILSKVKKMLMF